MLEDKLLIWKLNLGNKDALGHIYEKYKNDLFALAIALSNDNTGAKDIVHDVFVSFAQSADKLQLRNNNLYFILQGFILKQISLANAVTLSFSYLRPSVTRKILSLKTVVKQPAPVPLMSLKIALLTMLPVLSSI